jgi:two-component system catabolic regulation response regulator CreB
MNDEERIRVLYIEDDCDSFEMIKVLLGFSRIELDSAASTGEAMARARAQRFDLYLLDSGLPDGNGFNLCRELRETDPMTPVLFYSGHAHPDEIKMGMAAGADGYIIKPHSDKLAETIFRLVASRRENSSAVKELPVLAAAA